MAQARKGKEVREDVVIKLAGAETPDILAVEPTYLADKLIRIPQIIHNYDFAGEIGRILRSPVSSEPVGPAADQCYKFEIENNAIDLTWNATIATAPPGCVFLSSAVIEKEAGQPGKATFVICCQKRDDGKCKDCATVVTLTVSKGVRTVTKQVKIFCRSN